MLSIFFSGICFLRFGDDNALEIADNVLFNFSSKSFLFFNCSNLILGSLKRFLSLINLKLISFKLGFSLSSIHFLLLFNSF